MPLAGPVALGLQASQLTVEFARSRSTGNSRSDVGISPRWDFLPFSLYREISFETGNKSIHIRGNDVQFAANVLGFTRFQATDAKVVVHAGDHTLKDLLIWFSGHRHDLSAICGKATGKSVGRNQRT